MSAEHILVIEDDRLITALLQSRLVTEGYRVTVAPSVAAALAAASTEIPDLVVLDLSLRNDDPFSGVCDGFAFLQFFRRSNPAIELLVIIHSVNNSPTVAARAKSLGVCAVIVKGGGIGVLLSTIRTALDGRKSKPAAPAVV